MFSIFLSPTLRALQERQRYHTEPPCGMDRHSPIVAQEFPQRQEPNGADVAKF